MPMIGIVRGFGEDAAATDCVVKLIKALNRRFRSSIHFEMIDCGDYIAHGSLLTNNVLHRIKQCDCIFVSDFESRHNPIEFTKSDIAYALSANIEYLHIEGFDNCAKTDVCIASYFDGGFRMREGNATTEGCEETRVCSAFAMSNIVKEVSRKCEARRRRLAFVKDSENEYCADYFRHFFQQFTLPLSNFQFVEFTAREFSKTFLSSPDAFDMVFASKTFADTIGGVAEFLMKDKYASYRCYNSEIPVYTVSSLQSNSACGEYIPSICCYIAALSGLLGNEFNMEKEAVQLKKATDIALNEVVNFHSANSFINVIINALNIPVTTKYSKKPTKSRYIK